LANTAADQEYLATLKPGGDNKQIMAKLNLQGDLQRNRPKRRRIRAISIAPALLTLGNLLCGFAAIHFASRPWYGIHNQLLEKLLPTNLAMACYLIFAAMLCDALDGRLARFARTTSDFGAHLDSLADVVSFGAAPAFILVRLVMSVFPVVPDQAVSEEAMIGPMAGTAFGRFCWIAAGAYLACGALRLARFNVENVADESAHMNFKGLPIPGAAGALVSVVLLNGQVNPVSPLAGFSQVLAWAMPWIAISLGLLMVSRLKYVHVINRFLRGKKPFWVLVAAILVGLGFLLWPLLALAVSLCGYAVSGPVVWLTSFHKAREVETTTGSHELQQ